ncbi:hypothetical protein [Terasakiella sp. SH-1]|uniref:hypothetical protein n=1 Tax=Terasakiella sp. SH-1 TaxID=2560057 RepID=UPI0010742745|nr:hypothetical protein [Terasakiella sp. SH-1]
MAYRELGEARILKRYGKTDWLKPARVQVVPVARSASWQPLDLVVPHLQEDLNAACVAAQ